jgi:hypothetical protein
MRYEILDNGVVVNTIIASPDFMASNFAADTYRETAEPPVPPSVAALQLIQQMEREQILSQQRITRETILALAEERAAALGLTNAQLRAKNRGYAGLKALDEQIAALRAQL